MKKKAYLMVLALCAALAITACGTSTDQKDDKKPAAEAQDTTDKEDSESADSKESEETDSNKDSEEAASGDTRLVSVDDVSKYVTIGEYKGLTLDNTVEAVTDDMVDGRIKEELQNKAEEVTEGSVQNGDVVTINYVGTKDGVAFDGGTANNYELTIGSGTFIDGFEDGIIGMKKGETKVEPVKDSASDFTVQTGDDTSKLELSATRFTTASVKINGNQVWTGSLTPTVGHSVDIPKDTKEVNISLNNAPISSVKLNNKAVVIEPNSTIFKDCLPNRAKTLGYQTYSIHAASGGMYDRLDWYPKIGFGHSEFYGTIPQNGIRKCKSMPGLCDVDMMEHVFRQIKKEKKIFYYWLTLNSHFPYDDRDIFISHSICKQVSLDEDSQRCRHFLLQQQFFNALSEYIKMNRQQLAGTQVIIVGDHNPPFYTDRDREAFHENVVPLITFTIY